MIRSEFDRYGMQSGCVVDGVIGNWTLAFTDQMRLVTTLDGARMACCPKTFQNVVHHEIDHLKGRQHNHIPFDIMSYMVTVDEHGKVVEDAFVWQGMPRD